jgi:1,4-alpha-glucan branching enzyme
MLTGLLLLLAAQQAGDSVLFQCRTNGARVVYLAGDFNDWAHNQNGRITDPATAMTESNGVWRKVVKLEPGTWRFKFCVDGEPTAWFAPDCERDAEGNAILRVYPSGKIEVRSARNPQYRPQQTERGIRLQLFAPDAHIVYLAGSFNEWAKNRDGLVFDPQFAMSVSNGVWGATVALPPGRHAYQFVIDGDRWVVDPNVDEKDAKEHSVLVVE